MLRWVLAISSVAAVAVSTLVVTSQTVAAPSVWESPGLAVPHIRQEPLLCVPTSAAMVLAFYGDPQSPRRLKALAAGHAYDPHAPFNDFSITLFRDLVRGLRQLGYEWTARDYPDTASGFDDGVTAIAREVHAGYPALVDVSLPAGHTMVVRGVDGSRGQLYLVDPDAAAPGLRTVSYAQFAQIWNEHAYGLHFRSLIFTRPRSVR